MKNLNTFMIPKALIISAILLLNSCVQETSSTRMKSSTRSSLTGTTSTSPIDSSTSSTTDSSLFTQKVELSHLVDPFDGTYKKKLTLPKNFKGNLYLAGLNVSALTNKIVSVRFNFGTDKQSVVLNATVARAPGIVPKTDIQVLVIDMNSKPFNKMRLGYDLYDYNDYYTDASHPTTPTKEIVTDPRDGGLYCRGLNPQDDPTFQALSTTSTCSAIGDKCLYSYAKIVDSTLYSDQTVSSTVYRLSSIPTRSHVWSKSSGVRSPAISLFPATSCLPDDENYSVFNTLFDLSPAITGIAFNTAVSTGYYYQGPFRAIDYSNWKISSQAKYNSKYGLFQSDSSIIGIQGITGTHSFLFPRAGKLSLPPGSYYLGSDSYFGARTEDVTLSTGVSKYVDGCNLRVLNIDPASNEGIGSCNVNASIEVFYYSADGKEINITTDKTIKLQLIRPSLTNFEGKEVLTTAFKRCESSTTCGSDECCFNSRCWSKDLVTQCVDQTPVIGNQQIGDNCASDFECSSLCCNQSTGSCAPHNPNGSTPNYCNKSSGQQCVSKEFCQQVAVVTCKIVKSGFKADGTAACTLRCPAVMTYGDCKSGTCVPPTQPAVPAFDPNDCSQAVDP